VDVWLHAFLTLIVDGGEWSASHPGHPNLRKDPGNHWKNGCIGLRAGLDTVVKTKFPFPAHAVNETLVVQPIF